MDTAKIVWDAFKKWFVVSVISFFLYYISFYDLLNVTYWKGVSDITALSLLLISFILYCYQKIKWEERKLMFINRMKELGLSEKEAKWILTFPKDFIRNLLQITAQRYYDSIVEEKKKKEEVIVIEPI